jgi:hypothetical protein
MALIGVNGGLVGSRRSANAGAASGLWTANEQALLKRAGLWNAIIDFDANVYIASVERADGQPLEDAVKVAINTFVVGCKADGIWTAIKASCILAGARTLAGALVPLAGTAPTNNNFVSGDYNRETGLLGNGSTKYLNSNRNANNDPQNSSHISVYQTQHASRPASPARWSMGAYEQTLGSKGLATGSTLRYSIVNETTLFNVSDTSTATGLWAASRSSSVLTAVRFNGTNSSSSISSSASGAGNLMIFARSGFPATATTAIEHSDARIAFYSIGESLNLALLDTRVTALINAIAAAIP